LKIWFDGFVLLVELRQVGDDVLDNVGVGERVDFALCLDVGWDAAQACKSVNTINVHRAASADTLSAAPSECEGGVDLIFDSDQGIQHHWAGFVQIQGVALHAWLGGWLIRVPSVDVECLDLRVCIRSGFFDCRGLRWSHSTRRSGASNSSHGPRPYLGLEGWTCCREEARGGA